MVGAKGFEPSTSWSRTRRASQAALRPDNLQRIRQGIAQGFLEYHIPSRIGHGLFCYSPRHAVTDTCTKSAAPPTEQQTDSGARQKQNRRKAFAFRRLKHAS
jgi:hypothetical protein